MEQDHVIVGVMTEGTEINIYLKTPNKQTGFCVK